MDETAIARTVRDLADREEIRNLARRYAHCIWQGDLEGAVALFADDGEMDMDGRVIKGKPALADAYRSALQGTFHPFVHNHLVEVKGDTAKGTCYLDVRATIQGKAMIGSGFYLDRYVRAGGTWRFAARKLTINYLVPIAEGWAGPPPG
jgi:uncharacterized protein (TIGR02246 family)